jgi:hypothetical protein
VSRDAGRDDTPFFFSFLAPNFIFRFLSFLSILQAFQSFSQNQAATTMNFKNKESKDAADSLQADAAKMYSSVSLGVGTFSNDGDVNFLPATSSCTTLCTTGSLSSL